MLWTIFVLRGNAEKVIVGLSTDFLLHLGRQTLNVLQKFSDAFKHQAIFLPEICVVLARFRMNKILP